MQYDCYRQRVWLVLDCSRNVLSCPKGSAQFTNIRASVLVLYATRIPNTPNCFEWYETALDAYTVQRLNGTVAVLHWFDQRGAAAV